MAKIFAIVFAGILILAVLYFHHSADSAYNDPGYASGEWEK